MRGSILGWWCWIINVFGLNDSLESVYKKYEFEDHEFLLSL